MRKSIIYFLFVALASMAVSCSEYSRKPGRVYAPDMVYSKAVDYYNGTEKIEKELGSYSKMPAKGTIAREQALPDHIGENDTLLANANVCKINLTTKDVEEGQRLYNIYCGICHGSALDGNGPLYSSGKFIAMPANLKSGEKYLSMSAGRMYHGIVYGKNAMGSYASQLDTKQRWQVVAYIKKIQSENGGAPFTMVTDAPVVKDSVQVSAAETKEVKEHK
ncbi:MAG: cytochrome c [Bacteroidetes bacterium]|nr:cytochrome c [Bacteroidota bacterium]MBP6314036.1 cytochrome c [Chitinophagaceae bacterium]